MPKMGRRPSIGGPIAELAAKVGGVKELAAQVNVDPRTIRYWASRDRTPSGPSRMLLLQIGERYGIRLDFLAKPSADKRKVDGLC